MQGIEPRTSCMLGKSSPTQLELRANGWHFCFYAQGVGCWFSYFNLLMTSSLWLICIAVSCFPFSGDSICLFQSCGFCVCSQEELNTIFYFAKGTSVRLCSCVFPWLLFNWTQAWSQIEWVHTSPSHIFLVCLCACKLLKPLMTQFLYLLVWSKAKNGIHVIKLLKGLNE